jgi:hypothetical protein
VSRGDDRAATQGPEKSAIRAACRYARGGIAAEIEREPRDAKDAAMVAARFAETAARLGRAAAYDRIGELEAELERMKQTQVKLRAI